MSLQQAQTMAGTFWRDRRNLLVTFWRLYIMPSKGTLVLWERLDRIVTPSFTEQNVLDLVDVVERHLAMVFHRYLTGQSPALRIRLNDRLVESWDPFLSGHPATWTSPLVLLETDSGKIEMQGHVLPHKDRLTQNEQDLAARARRMDRATRILCLP